MATCARCGDESGFDDSGSAREHCDDCGTILGLTGQTRTGRRSRTLKVPNGKRKGQVEPLALSAGHRSVLNALKNKVRDGEPLSALEVRAAVEGALLRVMASDSAASVITATTKLMQLHGLGEAVKPDPADPVEQVHGPTPAKVKARRAKELAEELGLNAG